MTHSPEPWCRDPACGCRGVTAPVVVECGKTVVGFTEQEHANMRALALEIAADPRWPPECACNGIVRCAVHRQPVPRPPAVPGRLASEPEDDDEQDDDDAPDDDPPDDRMEFPGHEGM